MKIDENKLRQIIIKAVSLIEAENNNTEAGSRKKVYVICSEKWNKIYWDFFQKINDLKDYYDVYAVISSKVTDELHVNNLKKFEICKAVIDENDFDFNKLPVDYIVIFPLIKRNTVVKTALCINDIFETRWIFKAMAEGQKIILMKNGLERFTGREPAAYVKKILRYYRSLLEYEIEICDDIKSLMMEDCNSADHNLAEYRLISQNPAGDNLMSNSSAGGDFIDYQKSRRSKKVITGIDIDKYRTSKKIVLNDGDIITDTAVERAQELDIAIIRKHR